MKKVLSFVVIVALAAFMGLGLLSPSVTASAATQELRIYNWGDYMDLTIIKEFEDEYKAATGKEVKVVYSTFETNEEMITTVVRGGAAVDLICPSEYAIELLIRNNMLEKLDYTKIPNKTNVDQVIYDKVDAVFSDITAGGNSVMMSEYFVPYMWGTLGILYNTTVVSAEEAEEAGYGLLWNKSENPKLKNKIYLKDSIRDTYVAAVLYLKEEGRLPEGYENKSISELINGVSPEILAAAEEVLKEQKSVLHSYEVDFGKDEMVQGKGFVDLAWSGDALYAMEESEDLDYFVPEIGGNVWFDGFVVPKNAPNKDAALAFIDFICRPEIAIRNSIAIGYTSAVNKQILMADEDVLAILEENEYDAEEFFTNEIRYPDVESDKYGVMKDFGDKNADVVAMWERVKAHGSKTWILIVVIVAVAVVAGGVAAFFIIRSKKGTRRRVVKKA